MFARVTADRRLYVLGARVHHGLAGGLLIAAGLALVWDDRRDFPWPLRDRAPRCARD